MSGTVGNRARGLTRLSHFFAYPMASLLLSLMLVGCPTGVRDENGRINFGPSAYGDDPVSHNRYPSYAEYAVATGQLDDMAKAGYTREQQVCFAKALLNQLPQGLQSELQQFATGETTLMESEYAELIKRVSKFVRDEDVLRFGEADFKANCMEA